jgi:hypothetical protein
MGEITNWDGKFLYGCHGEKLRQFKLLVVFTPLAVLEYSLGLLILLCHGLVSINYQSRL